MNQKELDAIKERCDKATPGPWYWDVMDAHKCIHLESARWKVMGFARYGMNGAAPQFLVDGIMKRADDLLKSIPGKEHHRGFDNYIDHPDAEFIARARQDIPALIAEVERLQQAQRWIPVSERLPDNDDAVEAYNSAFGAFDAYYNGRVWLTRGHKINVTHWRIPEPPKEG